QANPPDQAKPPENAQANPPDQAKPPENAQAKPPDQAKPPENAQANPPDQAKPPDNATKPEDPKAAEYAKLVADGETAYVKSQTAKAAQLYRKALRLNPDGADANLDLGLALLDNDAKAAIPFLDKGLKADPGNARADKALAALGVAYQTTEKWKQAIDTYSLYLQKFPQGAQASDIQSALDQLKADHQ
ncbi:MAG: tetratricopeptide repeat protein, partial [Deltaproteobacteria bacterium]|nr:tetratricopeptide repeat protein [Deltaproteobacteria bacterium]